MLAVHTLEGLGKELTSKETSEKSKKAIEIVKRLKEEHPKATTKLIHKNPFQLLIATILSAQATDRQVNAVTESLFKEYSTPRDFANADLSELKELVRATGYFNQKAKRVKESARIITEQFNGRVPDSMPELLKLPGVGRKTANIVLSYGFGKNAGIAVDTHVFRLSKRLGLSEGESPNKVEADLMDLIPEKEWGYVNCTFIFHGRRVCTARKPEHKECVLFDLCPSKSI